MRRYLALAFDNISRDPGVSGCLCYRMGRLFIVRGTDDPKTTQQFAGSDWSMRRAGALCYLLLLFGAGVAIAWRAVRRCWCCCCRLSTCH